MGKQESLIGLSYRVWIDNPHKPQEKGFYRSYQIVTDPTSGKRSIVFRRRDSQTETYNPDQNLLQIELRPDLINMAIDESLGPKTFRHVIETYGKLTAITPPDEGCRPNPLKKPQETPKFHHFMDYLSVFRNHDCLLLTKGLLKKMGSRGISLKIAAEPKPIPISTLIGISVNITNRSVGLCYSSEKGLHFHTSALSDLTNVESYSPKD